MKGFFALIALFAVTLLPLSPVFADEVSESQAPATETIQDVIVTFNDSSVEVSNQSALAQFAEDTDVNVEDTLDTANSALVSAPAESAEALADMLELDPRVAYAEPNYTRSFSTISSNDTYNQLLWGLDNSGQFVANATGTPDADIDAPEAWTISTGTSTVVAVIDNGVLYSHPDIATNMWDGTNCVTETGATLGTCIHGYDFQNNDLDPAPDSPLSSNGTHGTHISGIIAASMNNATGTIGVAPNAKIMALRFGLDVASEVRAIDFARLNGAKIISASYSGPEFSQAEFDAIQRFTDAGGLFIAAAANNSSSNDIVPEYPASYENPNIISVAASTQTDALASFSNFGASSVDIAAPGVNILSTVTTTGLNYRYGYLSGTSMATPFVAGVAALIESKYPTLTNAQVKAAILSGSDSLAAFSGTSVSGGRLNAYGALLSAGGQTRDTTAPVITLTGAASLTLTVGDTYVELGATAVDDRDGTTTVSIGGDTVSSTTPGTYIVTYDATDTAGNHAIQVTRTVTAAALPVAPVIPVTPPTPVQPSTPSTDDENNSGSSGGSSGGGGGGGGGGSSRAVVVPSTQPSTVLMPVANPTRTLATGTVLGATTYQFTQTLSVGAKGDAVTELQKALTRLGSYTGPITGYYGTLTSSSVRAFQSAHLLPATGVLDAATRVSLNAAVATLPAAAVATTATSTAAILAQIKVLQALLAQLILLQKAGH